MSTNYTHKVLLDASAATVGDWYRVTEDIDAAERGLNIVVADGDTVTIDVATQPNKEDITANDWNTYATVTESAHLILTGNWSWIRASKTGTAGVAKVQGNL